MALLPLFFVAQQSTTVLPDSTYTHPPLSCSSCAGSLWSFETNAQVLDNQYTETTLMNYLFCFQSLCYRTRYLAANNFALTIPSDAAIDGIVVTISGFNSHPFSVRDSTIRLTKSYNMVGSNLPDTVSWSTQDMNRIYGAGSNLWGETWTPAEINDPGFGVFYKAYNYSDSTPVFKLDVVSITVQYTTPIGTFTQTSTPKQFYTHYDPSSSTVYVTFEPEQAGLDYSFQVMNISGTVVYEEQVADVAVFERRLSTISFSPGIYFVRFMGRDEQFIRKFPVAP